MQLNHQPFEKITKTKPENLRILVTNDDGVHAPGIKLLERVARSLSDDVWVVAPEMEQSGASHSLSINNPLRVTRHEERRFGVSGTPTDTVLLAVKTIFPKDQPPDLILSGVNRGSNLGEDVTYSGTVAAAMEGTLLDIPSIAFSQALYDYDDVPWSTAEAHAPRVIRHLLKTGWGPNILMNVNFPAIAPEEVNGIRAVPHGRRRIGDKLAQNKDPKGRTYYWIGADRWDQSEWPGSDIDVITQGYISITPISMDLTDYKTLASMKDALESYPHVDTIP